MDDETRKLLDGAIENMNVVKCMEIINKVISLFGENKCNLGEMNFIVSNLKDFVETVKIVKIIKKDL